LTPAIEQQARNRHWLLALGVALVTGAGYAIGSGRAFDYDGGITVHHFVATPSLRDAITRQVVFNNHYLFSLLEHVIYTVTGSASEVVMRIAPITLGAGTVGLLAHALARRWGLLPALAGAVVLATNPAFLSFSGEVRGYSLLTLAAVASTLLLLRLQEHGPSRIVGTGYIVTVAAGLATNPYMVFVVVGHVVYLAVHRGITWRWWVVRWPAGLLLGGIPQFVNRKATRATVRARGRHFQPGFPVELARSLLGTRTIAAVLVLALVLVACWHYRPSRALVALVLTYTAAVAVIWRWWAPFDLYTRLFIWLTPVVAVGVAVAVARYRPLALLAIAAATVSLVPQLDGYTEDGLATRAASRVIGDLRTEAVCSLGWRTEALEVYETTRQVNDVAGLDGCALVVDLVPSQDPALTAAASRRFAYSFVLRARTPGLLFSNVRLPQARR
jgi:hypothetical protein